MDHLKKRGFFDLKFFERLRHGCYKPFERRTTVSTKFTASAAGVVILGTLSCTAALATSSAHNIDNQRINHKIDSLQQQINQLKRQLRKQKRRSSSQSKHTFMSSLFTGEITVPCKKGECTYNPGRISIGPYLNQDQLYDGSELVINMATVREQARLLLAQQRLSEELAELGIPQPLYPRLQFSGKLEGLLTYNNPYIGNGNTNVNFSGAELDTLVQASSFVSGYMALDYDPGQANNGSRVFMNRAFVTIGNLAKLPLYGTIGQLYTSFGRYSSGMVTSPTTLVLGRTRARTLELGFQQTGKNAFHAALYTYQGLTSAVGSTNTNNQWGADAGYAYSLGKVTGEIGASYISNLGDSQGLQGAVFTNSVIFPTIPTTQVHNVQAADAYASLSFGPVVFIGEYVAALQSFNYLNVPFANGGAQPTALHVEGNYTFKTGTKPSSLGVGFDQTEQALAIGLPQESYEVFYNVNIFKDTNLGLEYRHDVNYSANAASTGSNATPANIVPTLGRTDNVFSACFDLYF